MTNTELLREQIKSSGYKRSYLARKVGISPAALRYKIKSEREFKASEIDCLCKLLSLDGELRDRIFFMPRGD